MAEKSIITDKQFRQAISALDKLSTHKNRDLANASKRFGSSLKATKPKPMKRTAASRKHAATWNRPEPTDKDLDTEAQRFIDEILALVPDDALQMRRRRSRTIAFQCLDDLQDSLLLKRPLLLSTIALAVCLASSVIPGANPKS